MFKHTKPKEWLMFSLIFKNINALVNIVKIKMSPFTVSLRKNLQIKITAIHEIDSQSRFDSLR